MTSSEVNTFSLAGFSDKNDGVGDSRTAPAASGVGKGSYRSF